MGKARARKTDNRVSMETATSFTALKAEKARRNRAFLAGDEHHPGNLNALRDKLTSASKAETVAILKQIAKEQGPLAYRRALPLINPTYRGMDVIPEKIANMKKVK
jgi:hypothetical protein